MSDVNYSQRIAAVKAEMEKAHMAGHDIHSSTMGDLMAELDNLVWESENSPRGPSSQTSHTVQPTPLPQLGHPDSELEYYRSRTVLSQIPSDSLEGGSARPALPDPSFNFDHWAELMEQNDSEEASDSDEESAESKDLVTFPDLGYKKGDRVKGDATYAFCPLRLVSRYADMYVGKANKPRVRPYFELEAFLGAQQWDFFYLYNTADQSGKPFVLLLTSQLQKFLQIINEGLNINLTIPVDHDGDFNISFARFQQQSGPCPRYLGQATDLDTFDNLATAIPAPDPEDNANKLVGLDSKIFQDTWKAMKNSTGVVPKKKKKDQKHMMRAAMHKGWGHTTKRVQRYLGLRTKLANGNEFTAHTEEQPLLAELDLDSLPPFWPEDFVVFICVDCETYEHNQNIVTEVGFGILDTKDLAGLPPGGDGRNWFQKIRGRHLRIKERASMVNTKYVKGCPDDFNFGNSEFVLQSEVRRVIEQILAQTTFPYNDRRPVVLVGHDVQQDVLHLSKVGVEVDKAWNIREIVDSQGLHQFMNRLTQGQKLERVLADFEIPYSHLHNAGNDAVYTLQSMIVTAVRQRQASLQRAGAKTSQSADNSQPSADEGWSSGGEGCDGGAPPSSALNRPSREELPQDEFVDLLQD